VRARPHKPGRRGALSAWLIIPVVGGFAAGVIYLLRRGARGSRSSRLLGNVLHLAAKAPLARLASGVHARVYSRTGGRVLSRWFGNPVLVIETVGRRSGERRATAITYVPQGEKWVVMPINAGSDRTPSWWRNLQAAGRGFAIVGGQRTEVVPRIADGEERNELWRAYVRQAPAMLEYARLTARDVPVVVLERIEEPGGPSTSSDPAATGAFDEAIARILSCGLDEAGVREQRARYARLAPSVKRLKRELEALVLEFHEGFDRDTLDQALAVERACCPFFRFELEESERRLRTTVRDAEQLPALDAMAHAFGAAQQVTTRD
jgi:F420H(2)-dependent quinone reductase